MQTTQTRTLDTADLHLVQTAVDKANKRAAKIGVTGYALTTEPADPRPIYRPNLFTAIEGTYDIVGYVEQVTVTVTGEAPKYAGWSFVATLTWDEVTGECVTRKVPGVAEDITLPRPKDQWCDHCETARLRKDTYLLQHEDGSFKQVGSTCLAEFLGVEVHLHLLGFNPYDGVEDNRPRQPERLVAQSVLADVQAIIRAFGWVSGGAAYNDPSKTSTKQRLVAAYSYRPGRADTYGKFEFDALRENRKEGDEQFAIDTIAWVRSLAGKNDYEANLQAAIGHEVRELLDGTTVEYDTFRIDNLGLVVSAINGYQRSLDRAAEKAAQQRVSAKSEWVGQPKDKIVVENAELLSQRYIDSDWGTTILLTFRAADGNVFKWFASNPGEVEVGAHYTVKGTVKKHETYNDLKSTVLTRCGLTKTEVAA